MPVVSITRLRVRAWRYLPPFFIRTHGPAMRKLLEWCDEASLVHWTQDGPDLPAWDEAHRRLEAEGHPSKVHHPSPAHTAHKFPPPVVRKTGELPVKR